MMKIKSLICMSLVLAVGACERTDAPKPPIRHETPPTPPLPDPPPPPPSPGASLVYPAGSLIIPTSGTYQTSCGAVSAYGLIYNILRANNYLASFYGLPKITVHYAFNSAKSSPNRCVPAIKGSPFPMMPPAPNNGTPTDPTWNDGCDFVLTGATLPLAKEITNTAASNPASDIGLTTISTTGSTTQFPTFPSVAIGATITKLQYLGGPFIIGAADANTFGKLLEGSLIAKDDFGQNIDFSPFRTNRGSCTFGTDHYVRIHRAANAFTAPNNLAFTQTPPRLALLATNNAGMTAKVDDGILETYLQNSGLTFAGAQGCPPGGFNASKKAICPNKGTPGQIFDKFDFADLKNNLHTLTDGSGKPLYSSVWAPHWETTASSTGSPNSNEGTATNNLDSWLSSNQNGFMGECHSIEALEGAYLGGSKDQVKSKQFLTCVNNGAGACAAATTNWGVDKNTTGTPSGKLKNCSDPSMSNGQQCAFHGYPGDSFSQTADYLWDAVSGSVSSFRPNPTTNAIYRPGTLVTISGVGSLNKALLGSPSAARPMIKSDYVMYGFRNSNPAQGAIHYLGGHDQSSGLAGNLVVMQTLLQLGIPPTSVAPVTKEVARSAPVLAKVNGIDQLFQGTFEKTVPAPSPVGAPFSVTTDVNSTLFTFPYIRGHFRGFDTSDITTSIDTFTNVSSTFDTANLIPPANYAGCGTHFTDACRTVFTNTNTGPGSLIPCAAGGTCRIPDSGNGAGMPLFIEQASKAKLLGTLVPSVVTTPANQDLVLSRVLAGTNVGGVYVPKLGGVDRSTATIVGPSSVDGGTRPTMAYFGATDGMLHAVCLNIQGNCTQIGQELWAYIPRVNLGRLTSANAVVDGSPRAIDALGDFGCNNAGTPCIPGSPPKNRTILTFQVGASVYSATDTPAVYALDVTDPFDPRIIWEYTPKVPRTAYELGVGLTIAMGPVQFGVTSKQVTFVQTNNAGTNGVVKAGSVITALDTQTGAVIWQRGYDYPAPRTGGDPPLFQGPFPGGAGIPGGAVGIDYVGAGNITDLIFADLYGNVYQIDPATGVSRNGLDASSNNVPRFQTAADFRPIGSVPAIYSNAGNQYALITTGGNVDGENFPPCDPATVSGCGWYDPATNAPMFPGRSFLWSNGTQKAVAVRLMRPPYPAVVPPAFIPSVSETATVPPGVDGNAAADVAFALDLKAGDKGFSQALIVGNQIFLNTDNTDVNNASDAGFGTGGNTGSAFAIDMTGANVAGHTVAVVGSVLSGGDAISGGGTSMVSSGNNVYGSNGLGMEQVPVGNNGGAGVRVDYSSASGAKIVRTLWLRSL